MLDLGAHRESYGSHISGASEARGLIMGQKGSREAEAPRARRLPQEAKSRRRLPAPLADLTQVVRRRRRVVTNLAARYRDVRALPRREPLRRLVFNIALAERRDHRAG